LRRKESLKTWAKRPGVTVPTLQQLEAGDPGVSIGIVAPTPVKKRQRINL
jgi:hypothetical protein